MGFSPGDFSALVHGKLVPLHFEAKGESRIVLWVDDESSVVFEVDVVNAALMVAQLQTCLYSLGEEQ
jgi:hypothetical protein